MRTTWLVGVLWLVGCSAMPMMDGGTGGGGGAGSGMDGGCLPGRACNPTCTGQADCRGNESCIGGICGQGAATSTDYSACALDADCPRGDFCKLGSCRHDCLADRDCDGGTVCSLRGKCMAAEAVTAPPTVTPPSKGVPCSVSC